MNKTERLKLAKAARELAMECVEGTAPKFGTGREFVNGQPWCVMGHAAVRAGIEPWSINEMSPVIAALGDTAAWWAVSSANDGCRDALPWALLWLADELASI